MNLRHVARFRGPALAAISTLLLAGASSVALAGNPSIPPASTGTVAEEPESTGPDTDLVQFEDQSGAADTGEAGEPVAEGSEVAGAESDGPGGHDDAAGAADHEFDGEE